MINKGMAKAIMLVCSSSMLQGCFEEELDQWANRKTYDFKGEYINQYNSDRLIFDQGTVYHEIEGMTRISKVYRVEDGMIYIQQRNSSKEHREDIKMRIHGSGELLTCQQCAKHQLSNVWQLAPQELQ
ncbi:hypothetical protein [Vibrio sonorensis]|uniref:hypothetical protein n=1 Tax=Vibrio sonorensis TaxID=1004316 RepID=UPI0008DB1BF3|nr:hypothetical protein [Vibrio sonorensis]